MTEKKRNNTKMAESMGNALRNGMETAGNTIENAVDAVGGATEAVVNRTVKTVQNLDNPLTDRNNEDNR
jgi:hypothetical protein